MTTPYLNALTLSYDDGVGQDVRLMSILREHGMKATFNLDSGKMGVGGIRADGVEVRQMLPEEMKESYYGFEMAVHGYAHPFLTLMPMDMVAREVAKDREEMEKLTGYPVRGMAYPIWHLSQRIDRAAAGAGHRLCKNGKQHGRIFAAQGFPCVASHRPS